MFLNNEGTGDALISPLTFPSFDDPNADKLNGFFVSFSLFSPSLKPPVVVEVAFSTGLPPNENPPALADDFSSLFSSVKSFLH